MASCVWGCRRDRGLELETFGSLNTLQFTFLALRLDDVTTWKWKVSRSIEREQWLVAE